MRICDICRQKTKNTGIYLRGIGNVELCDKHEAELAQMFEGLREKARSIPEKSKRGKGS